MHVSTCQQFGGKGLKRKKTLLCRTSVRGLAGDKWQWQCTTCDEVVESLPKLVMMEANLCCRRQFVTCKD